MRKLSCKTARLVVLTFLVYASLAGPAEPALASSGSSILEPPSGALLGQYYGAGSVAQAAAKLGRTLPIHLTYYAWDADWTGTVTKADLAAGRIPLVNWEPHHIDFAKIVDGSLDATIMARAKGSKALGKKFFLDFAAEMNGDEAWSGNNASLYVSAYRHIHDLFVAAGAANVVWAWCPNVTDVDGENRHTMDYYPGDSYVDWTGVDGYNWGTKNGGWQSFHDVFRNIYPLLAKKKKPILIGEMSSAEAGGDKAKWIDEIIPTLRNSFPLIKGLVWFDVNKEADWRISSSPASEAAFIRMANDPYLNP
ncbi:MAG TPA: glycosyl hydrolase [Terriglobales bacterium]